MAAVTGAASVLVLTVLLLVWSALEIQRHKLAQREQARRAGYQAWRLTRVAAKLAMTRTPKGWNHV